ncbi:MAG: LysR family transcriptional regulator [Dermatophilaceae bacterium]
MDLDLGDVRAFVELAQWHHFAVTAEVLFVDASTLSKRIHRLEHTVGERLVDRDPAGVHGLTRAGRRFLPGAVAVLDQAAYVVQEARSGRDGTLVRVGVPGALSVSPTEPFIARLRAALLMTSPGTQLHLVGLPFPLMWSAVADERADIVVNSVEAPDPRIASVPIARLERIAVVARRHPLADAAVVSADDLTRHALLDDPSLPRDWMSAWHLGDVTGPRASPTLVESLPTIGSVMRHIARGRAVAVTAGIFAPQHGPFAILRLSDAPLLTYYAQRRRSDTRRAVAAVIRSMHDSLALPAVLGS